MLWIITQDHLTKTLENCPSRVDTFNTHNAKRLEKWNAAEREQQVALLREWTAECDHEFRLYDDDGELYYSGVCLKLDQMSGDSAFEPLDWARADAGCERMDYRKKGETKWKIL
jgi:hypothetical protein